jgi:hypothetical protein
VDFTTCAQLLCAVAIILPFNLGPESKIQNHIHSQRQQAPGNLPQQRFNLPVPVIVLRFIHIVTKQVRGPFVRRQPQYSNLLF